MASHHLFLTIAQSRQEVRVGGNDRAVELELDDGLGSADRSHLRFQFHHPIGFCSARLGSIEQLEHLVFSKAKSWTHGEPQRRGRSVRLVCLIYEFSIATS